MIKKFSVLLFVGLFFGCNAQSQQGNTANQNLAANGITKTAGQAVATIESVTGNGKDKPANFSWTADGKSSNFAELTKGKVVFLNFWATWCPPCRREIPDIIELTNDLKDKKFVAIGVSLDQGEGAADKVGAFVDKNKMNYLNLLGGGDISDAYGGIQSIPTTFIIDQNGKIVEKIVGSRSKADFMALVNKYIQ